MEFREKSIVLEKGQIQRALTRISHEILEKNKTTKDLVIVGIRNRGVFLAQRLSKFIEGISKFRPPVGILDITLYRDDLTEIGPQPVVHRTEIDFDISKKTVILVDDVLFTGRTIRCALDALIDFGRPKSVQLAILIDRGHRELPIRADYVGKNIPTSLKENVEVRLQEVDRKDEVVILERK